MKAENIPASTSSNIIPNAPPLFSINFIGPSFVMSKNLNNTKDNKCKYIHTPADAEAIS